MGLHGLHGVALGYTWVALGYMWVALGYMWVTWATWVTLGYTRVTLGYMWVALGYMWVALGYMGQDMGLHGPHVGYIGVGVHGLRVALDFFYGPITRDPLGVGLQTHTPIERPAQGLSFDAGVDSARVQLLNVEPLARTAALRRVQK